MKQVNQNLNGVNGSNQGAEILHSMISSFKIENIVISETTAQMIYEKVRSKLKK